VVQRSHKRGTDVSTHVMHLQAMRTAGQELRFRTVQRAAVVAASLVALAGAVVLVWVAKWIGLAAAVGAAMAWCAWLGRHPESSGDADGEEQDYSVSTTNR
jgi:hypothetical protein